MKEEPSCASFPLSFAQRRLYALAERAERATTFTESRCFVVAGPLDPAALRTAVDTLVDRHEPLRTTFPVMADGAAVQRVHPARPVPVDVVDLAAASAPESAAEAVVTATVTRPFDLAVGPLLRVAALRLGPLDWRLVFVLHHLVADAWSLRIFFREMAEAYAERVMGTPLDLPALPVQYVDWAAWQQEQLTEARVAELLSWWEQELAGANVGVPTAVRHHSGPSGCRIDLELPATVTTALSELARSENTTTFTVLAAACGLVVARWIGAESVVLLIPTANRDQPQTHSMLGFFVDAMPLRIDIAGRPALPELLERVRTAAVRAHEHRALPYPRMEEELMTRAATAPLHFTYRPARHLGGFALAGCTTVERPTAAVGAKFELAISVDEHEQYLGIGAEFDQTLFDPADIAELLHDYSAQLQSLANVPESRA